MFWIIETIIFSILFILIIHYLYDFLKLNLTTPLVKDLASSQSNKYKEIYDILKSSSEMVPPPTAVIKEQPSTPFVTESRYDELYSIPNSMSESFLKQDTMHRRMDHANMDMKSELKQFLKSQMNE